MRIISKYHDYYDGVMAHGFDEDCVFLRNETELFYKRGDTRLNNSVLGRLMHDSRSHNGIERRVLVVGFCGKIYLCYHLKAYTRGTFSLKEEEYCYSAEAVRKFVERNCDKDDYTGYMKDKRDYRGMMEYALRLGYEYTDFYNGAVEYNFLSLNKDCMYNYFIDNKVSWFVMYKTYVNGDLGRCTKMVHHPKLATFQFQKVFDPYQAYQEIMMFYTGILGIGEPAMVQISDEDMRDKKGFDKNSFKTRKGTHPNRKAK